MNIFFATMASEPLRGGGAGEEVDIIDDGNSFSRLERDAVMIPLQKLRVFDVPAIILGYCVDGKGLLPLFSVLYWCIDQHKCIVGIWLVPLSEIANGCVKWLIRRPRPAWVDGRIRLLAFSHEFSFPSSHSQLAGAVAQFFVSASYHPEATSVTPAWPAYAFVAAVMLSRVHVGLHYPSDVVAGAAVGIISAAVYANMVPAIFEIAPSEPGALLAALAVPLVAAILALILCYRHAVATAPLDHHEWRRLACRGKYSARRLDPRGVPLGEYTGMIGVLTGLIIGVSFKQQHPLVFATDMHSSVARGVLGNVGLMALFETIAFLTPERPLALYASLRFLKYVMVPLYIIHLAPWLFARMGI